MRFPTVEALAFATSDEVMQQWEGLGYYSRARNLHAAAKQIIDMGTFPRDYSGVRALKGVGDYTAAAICSFAFGLPHAVVDGNVYRVLSRYFGLDAPIDITAGKKAFASLASGLLDLRNPALYNQAIMDFGALQCVPKSPDCSRCPLADSCAAFGDNRVEQLPVKSKRTAVKERFFAYIIILDECSVYIHRRGEGDIWAGLYEPLVVETPRRASAEEVVPRRFCIVKVIEGLKHQLTHRTLFADAYVVKPEENSVLSTLLPPDFIKVPLERLHDYAAPRLVNIIYEKLNFA